MKDMHKTTEDSKTVLTELDKRLLKAPLCIKLNSLSYE